MRYACGLAISARATPVTQSTLTITQAIKLAASHLNSGYYEQAAELCYEVLKVDTLNADAFHFLGLMAANQGQASQALKFLSQAVAARPDDFELHNNLGNLHKALNDPEAARTCYEQCLLLNAECCPAYLNLGLVLSALNRLDEAVVAYRKALSLEPGFVQAHVNVALVLRKLNRSSEAIEHLAKAIATSPDYVEAHVSLGNTYAEMGDLDQAIKIYRAALPLKDDDPGLYNNLAVALTGQGKYAEAERALLKALEYADHFVEARNNLGVVQRHLGKWQEAQASFYAAIKANPQYSEAFRNLGQCLADQGKYQLAVESYNQAIALAPSYYEAALELAVCYSSMGASTEAVRQFDQAQSLNPGSIAPIWGACMASLPNFYENEQQIEVSRKQFELALDNLESKLDLSEPAKIQDAFEAVGLLQPFFLTYQARNNRELLAKYGQLVCQVMQARYPQFSAPLERPTLRSHEPIRIGIVSRHFSDHSDFKVIINGLIQGVDRSRFRTYGYFTGGLRDDVTEACAEKMDTFIQGLGFDELLNRIQKDNLHVIIYPEIGMDPTSLKLAALRLAPVQCVGWARPETCGLDTIDYFLSSDLMEPADAENHYTEKLVRLPNLFSYYEPNELSPEREPLEALSDADDVVRYVCVQSLFKYLPAHDQIFPLIAKQVPNAQFVFVAKPQDIAEKLKSRLHNVFQAHGLDASKYLFFLPLLSKDKFAALLDSAHIFLDSVEYSGCLTTLDAIAHSLPVVTMDGAFLRGRQSQAMLALMGIEETVAKNLEEYVEIAVRLAHDEVFRCHIAAETEAKRYFLYRDYETINALQAFLSQLFPSPAK